MQYSPTSFIESATTKETTMNTDISEPFLYSLTVSATVSKCPFPAKTVRKNKRTYLHALNKRSFEFLFELRLEKRKYSPNIFALSLTVSATDRKMYGSYYFSQRGLNQKKVLYV